MLPFGCHMAHSSHDNFAYQDGFLTEKFGHTNYCIYQLYSESVEFESQLSHLVRYSSRLDSVPSDKCWDKDVKLSLCLIQHSATGEYSIAPRILNRSRGWTRLAGFTLQSLYPGRKSRWYPLKRSWGQPPNRSELCVGYRNIFPVLGSKP
jgi:hypothetical protein